MFHPVIFNRIEHQFIFIYNLHNLKNGVLEIILFIFTIKYIFFKRIIEAILSGPAFKNLQFTIYMPE